MAKLGKSRVGLTDLQINNLAIVSGPYLASEDGTIDDIAVYTETLGVNLRTGVYLQQEDHATSPRPTTLVASSDLITVSQPGWQILRRTSEPGTIQRGKRYWIASISSGNITYKLNQQEEKWWWVQSPGTGTTLRNPFLIGGGSTIFRAISAYCLYTPILPAPEDTSLQAMINRATPGSTLKIPYGFYNEQIIINKSLNLVGVPNRRGKLPIIQGGELVDSWTPSAEPSHSGKNVWYKDVRIGGVSPAVWIRSLQLGDLGVQILQYDPSLSGEGVNAATATTVRNYLLTCDWTAPGYYLGVNTTQTIDFWQWYDAIACHDSTGRLWLRMKNGVDPNDFDSYITATKNTRNTPYNDDWAYTNDLSKVIHCSSQSNISISNLEIRGGRWGIDIQNSDNVLVEKCKIVNSGLRGISITDCATVTIQANEFTSKWLRSNVHPGFGGTSERAKAAMFGWDLNKNYSVSGIPAPNGDSIELCGVTTGVSIKHNWMHDVGGGIGWGYGFDPHAIDATIENNRLERMDSAGVVVYPRANGIIRYNDFYEVHLNFRVQDMTPTSFINTLVNIYNNTLKSVEQAGYLLQAHYASGTTWASPINFESNFIQNISHIIANLLGFADVMMVGNVLDTANGFTSAVDTYGLAAFETNWVGGNAEEIKDNAWFVGNGNEYIQGQRLVDSTLPIGFESVGIYRQNTGLPVKRRVQSEENNSPSMTDGFEGF